MSHEIVHIGQVVLTTGGTMESSSIR